MPQFGWRQQGSVGQWLFAEPWEFEFFQAVRLLELLYPERVPPGEGVDPDEEVVRFHTQVSNVFPGAEVQAVEAPDNPGDPPSMTVNLLPLAGAQGPLPDADGDRVIERAWRKDYGFRDFLDIFHHRLLSLLVRTRKAHHPAYTSEAPHQGPIARYLYAFFGLALAEQQDRMHVADRSLIFYSGILSQQPRSASGLERLLSDYFQAPARVVQLVGQWRELGPGEWTRLGASGQNRRLGSGVLLGQRIWDQQGGFEVRLGPLPLPVFLDFLPNGSGYQPLCEMTRFYAGPEFDFCFRLTLRGADVPPCGLGTSRLGWTSWLNTRGFTHDDSQTRLSARAPADPFARLSMESMPVS
jgi:type VI secretion system protein ImpH